MICERNFGEGDDFEHIAELGEYELEDLQSDFVLRVFDDDAQHVIFPTLFLLQAVDILKDLLILIQLAKIGRRIHQKNKPLEQETFRFSVLYGC